MDGMESGVNGRPQVLIVCHALSGHLAPLISIAGGLTQRGWPVSFLGATVHRHRIEASGSEFLPLTGIADFNDKLYYEQPPFPEYASLTWVERVKVDLRLQCLEPIPTQFEDLKRALATLSARRPHGQIIVVSEAFFLGILPLKYGARLPTGLAPPRSMCVSVTVPALRSVDLPPVGFAVPFDRSPAGRARNAAMWDRWASSAGSTALAELLDGKLAEAGATRKIGEPFLAGANYRCHDAICQLGVPAFEYPRSDWPEGFRFAGLVQGAGTGAGRTEPTDPPFSWWGELRANSALDKTGRKTVVVVTQGTVEINPDDLMVPTMQALADRHDMLVVAILGWKGARLSDLMAVPGNARVADYMAYDAVLAHADVWVQNAGFGAVNHGIAWGVPMVVAGEGMDKTENARRVSWSGIGIDLGCARPSVEQLRRAVDEVLANPSYSERVAVLRRQSEAMDSFGIIHEELLKLTRR